MKDELRPGAESDCHGVNGSQLLTFGISADTPNLADKVVDAFSSVSLAHLIVFASPSCDFADLIGTLHHSFKCPVVGCTSAGEISNEGFVEGSIVVVGLPTRWFAARTVLIQNLSTTDFGELNDTLIQNANGNLQQLADPDIDARFDYVRFLRPTVPAALVGRDLSDLGVVSDAELLAFLGFDL